MSRIIKTKDQPLTEELALSLLGKILHVPTNMHDVFDHMENEEKTMNAWFAGQCAGIEKAVLAYNYEEGTLLPEPVTYLNLLLTDGKGYLLSETELEIVELTDKEWEAMIAEHESQIVLTDTQKDMILPEKKIILPEDLK